MSYEKPTMISSGDRTIPWSGFRDSTTIVVHLDDSHPIYRKQIISDSGEGEREGRKETLLSLGQLRDAFSDMKTLSVSNLDLFAGTIMEGDSLTEILTEANRAGHLPILHTTGAGIEKNLAQELRERVSEVAVSLAGDETNHNELHGSAEAYRRSVSAMENLHAAGVPFSVEFTMTKGNLEDLPLVASLAAKWGAKTLNIRPLPSTGSSQLDEFLPDGRDLQRIYRLVVTLTEEYKVLMPLALWSLEWKSVVEHPCTMCACWSTTCHRWSQAEPGFIHLLPDGTLLPLMPGIAPSYGIGNLRDGRMTDLVKEYMEGEGLRRFRRLCRHVFYTSVLEYGHPFVPWEDMVLEESLRSFEAAVR